ncbi:peptidase M20 [Solibacillus sp. R5-41]|uniref:M20 family metallopeptidase n=1 Tax=Solibacillus sp. R5-41 TaxID=2048654 RepID=UPI000C129600|nr:M20 family metallopeptidase [Solibacillus sp. R5-41]ATP38919.1 peptidase M20 [Solibacillus sp. R5-41]
MNQLKTKLQESFEEMVIIRRYLHEYPELSHEEVHTPIYIANFHRELGLEVREQVGGRGVVATLRGAKPGKTVALRADFDGLAINELNDIPYKSKNDGIMHACGHDGHTATLLVLAKVLTEMQEELVGNVVFIHQHAEELAPGGAKAMIEDGCLEGVDVIYGTHLWAPTPLGDVLVREGAIMAAADRFEITIQGKGGHGAEPQHSVDAIVIGSHFVTQLQTLVSRRIAPLYSAVVTVGHFEAINPFNVIADTVKLKGTVRTFDENVRQQIKQEIEQLLQATCTGMHATYKYEYFDGYPPVINHAEDTQFVAQVAEQIDVVKNVQKCPPFMIGEDFGYYMQHVPGTFFFTGAKDPCWDQAYPHHHGRFNFDERAMLIAAQILGEATVAYLTKNN